MSNRSMQIPLIAPEKMALANHVRVAGPNSFFYQRQIRFGECDPAGIVYYPRYTDMFHEVTEDWWQWALGVEFNAMLRVGLGWPLVSLQTDFLKENRAGDFVDFELSIARIGSKSLETHIQCFRRDGEPSIRARLVQVALDVHHYRSLTIPSSIRERLEAFRDSGTRAPESSSVLIISPEELES